MLSQKANILHNSTGTVPKIRISTALLYSLAVRGESLLPVKSIKNLNTFSNTLNCVKMYGYFTDIPILLNNIS